jgi:toxin CcdB
MFQRLSEEFLMAQFDVYENGNPDTRQTFPYLLDVQAEILDDLPTRVVVPLLKACLLKKAAPVLNPGYTIASTHVFMFTAQIAAAPVRVLGKRVCSLKDERNTIIAALDMLLVGY